MSLAKLSLEPPDSQIELQASQKHLRAIRFLTLHPPKAFFHFNMIKFLMIHKQFALKVCFKSIFNNFHTKIHTIWSSHLAGLLKYIDVIQGRTRAFA